MINILKQSGKSICYLLVMLLPQVIVSVVITVGVIACLSMSNQAIFEYEAVMDSIYELMNPISIVSGLMSLYILFLYFTIREKNFFR